MINQTTQNRSYYMHRKRMKFGGGGGGKRERHLVSWLEERGRKKSEVEVQVG
jgi:hypothetical protein